MDRENINNDSVKKSLKDEFCVWSEVGRTAVEKEISEEYILPDYLPDIRKILLVRANSVNGETYLEDGKAEITGSVCFNVVYLGDTGEVKCVTQEYDYENTALIDGIYDESSVDVSVSVKNKSVRALSPRKLLIKARVIADVTVSNKLCVYPRVIGSTGIDDEFTLERRTNKLDCINYINFNEGDIRASEDIVYSGNTPIKELICSDIDLICGECKYSDGKLSIKGIAKIWCLLDVSQEGEKGVYDVLEKNIQINHSSETGLPKGEWSCYATLETGAFECSVANDSYGEPKIVEVDFSAKANILAMSNEESVFTDDVYSTAFDYQNRYKTVETRKLIKCSSVNFSAYGTGELQNNDVDEISGVTLSSADAEITYSETKEGKAVFGGECNVKAVLKLNDGSYRTEDISFPIRYEMNADSTVGDLSYMTKCSLIDHKAMLDGNKINISAEIGLNVAALEKVSAVTVEAVTIDKSAPMEKPNERVMILYYPEANETLWSVAKKYGISRSDILKANNLTDTSDIPRVLLIPTNIK